MPIDPNRAKEVLFAALKISDPALRSAYLDRECDAELRAWVDALLWAHERPETLAAADPLATGQLTPTPSDEPTATYTPHDKTGTFQSPASGDLRLTDAFSPTATYRSDPSQPASGDGLGSLIVGKYRIVEIIGEGGMGSVYLAQQNEPVKREVALKLIKHGADSRTVVARFEAERQALAMMDHPNIARVYDGGTTDRGQPFFVMELVRGTPITKFCDENRISPKDRLELFVQVCRAVQHAHQKGIIHRDLKPGNILVTMVDGRPTPKVIDFGVAKAIEMRLTDSSFVDEGSIVGTPAYMSPEQTDPSIADIDTRTDVYALGVVLYELLTGSPPISPKSFKRGAILEMLRMVREVEPDHLSTKASSADALPNIAASRGLEPAQLLSFLRGDVDWIVLKSLEKDRERRYDSANGMSADIMRYLANEPVVARPPSRLYRLKKFVRRNRGPVLASALILLAVVAGVVGVIVQWREAVYQRNQADLARKEAETQQIKAENNAKLAQGQRRVALDTLGRMVLTIRSEMSTKPGLGEVVQRLLAIAKESLDEIIQNPAVDISLNDTTRALIHDFKARMLKETPDKKAALQEFSLAAEIYQRILDQAADGPDKEIIKKNLMITLIQLGYNTLGVGTQAEARAYFDRAAILADSIQDKSALDFRKNLLGLYMSMGVVTINRSPREAREDYRRAIKVAEEIERQEAAQNKGKPTRETRLNLLQLYWLMGGVENRLRDPRASEEALKKALSTAADLNAAAPGNPGRARWEARIHERIGDHLLRSKQAGEAERKFATAAALFKGLYDDDKKGNEARSDYSRILYSQGLAANQIKAKSGDKYFQQSLTIRESRSDLKTDHSAQTDLMMSLARVGNHVAAVKWADDLLKTKLATDPGGLVDIANCYSVCSAVPGLDKATRDKYVAKALDTLRKAIDAGYGDKVNLETEPDLNAFRGEAEFKKQLDRVKEP